MQVRLSLLGIVHTLMEGNTFSRMVLMTSSSFDEPSVSPEAPSYLPWAPCLYKRLACREGKESPGSGDNEGHKQKTHLCVTKISNDEMISL